MHLAGELDKTLLAFLRRAAVIIETILACRPLEFGFPLNELAAAVQSAVEQVLGKLGAGPIDKL
jgi:hypothetical protein